MLELLKKETINELLAINDKPCLSLYMTAHKTHPENLQDVIYFKNLVKQLEDSLLTQYSKIEMVKFVEPFHALMSDAEFWKHASEGLAVFSANGLFRTIGLQVPVEELVVVADSFHTKPLRQYLQSTDRYQVLCLSLDRIRFFEGNRHALAEVIIAEKMPKTLTEVLGKDLTDKHATVASYGGVGAGSGDMHHGDGGRKDQIDKDTEKFFRFIDKQIFENYSKPSGLPLILAALAEHHQLFRKITKNPLLLPDGITKNPESLSPDQMITLTWEVMEPVYLHKLRMASDNFKQAKANNKGTDYIKEAAEAAASGRLDTLLIEANRMIAGRIVNVETGAIKSGELSNPETDDLLDDIAELAIRSGAKVLVIPQDNMPSQTGLAAILRY